MAPAAIDGISGTPGKCLAATAFMGSITLGSLGGATAIGLSGLSALMATWSSPITRIRVARVSCQVSPGKMRQLTMAVARCGRALEAWPASRRVAMQLVWRMALTFGSVAAMRAASTSAGLARSFLSAWPGASSRWARMPKPTRVVSVSLAGKV